MLQFVVFCELACVCVRRGKQSSILVHVNYVIYKDFYTSLEQRSQQTQPGNLEQRQAKEQRAHAGDNQ